MTLFQRVHTPSFIVKLANSWVLMNPGGPLTPDKPDISVVNYERGNAVSSFMNLRVSAKGGRVRYAADRSSC